MQYDAKTPAQYIEMLDDDWRKQTLLSLRILLTSLIPNVVEDISYKMLRYADAKGTLFQLNAQKGYVSLYVGNAKKIDPDGQLLNGIDVGKGCIRFKKSTVVSNTRIAEFITKAIEMRKRGEDFDCYT